MQRYNYSHMSQWFKYELLLQGCPDIGWVVYIEVSVSTSVSKINCFVVDCMVNESEYKCVRMLVPRFITVFTKAL
jgi:hypothetical protein